MLDFVRKSEGVFFGTGDIGDLRGSVRGVCHGDCSGGKWRLERGKWRFEKGANKTWGTNIGDEIMPLF